MGFAAVFTILISLHMDKMIFIYLHGFASSPSSNKARAFKERFEKISRNLRVPDLEGDDFKHLTVSGQIKIVEKLIDRDPSSQYALIGSSMGGYLAALLAQIRPQIAGLYLMCPGFRFVERWRNKLFNSHLKSIPLSIPVFNYRYNKYMDLDVGIFDDALKWGKVSMNRNLPTRIVHGVHDDTVGIVESREFAKSHPWVQLKELESDHGLISHIDWIVEDCLVFFQRQRFLTF